MSAEDRLQRLQAALSARGVKDVKFFFGGLSEKPLTQISSDVADALEAVVSGKGKPLPALNDSKRAK